MEKHFGTPLSPQEMRVIYGGVAMECTATADCGEGIYVSCSGTVACIAEDGDGVFCYTSTGYDPSYCPAAPGNS
jgi:hypothetical protein